MKERSLILDWVEGRGWQDHFQEKSDLDLSSPWQEESAEPRGGSIAGILRPDVSAVASHVGEEHA
jgi:hypothetical protein